MENFVSCGVASVTLGTILQPIICLSIRKPLMFVSCYIKNNKLINIEHCKNMPIFGVYLVRMWKNTDQKNST